MEIISRDNKFVISMEYSENANPLVCLRAKENVSIFDLANAIFWDCFCVDSCGLQIENSRILCKVITEKEYEFVIDRGTSTLEMTYQISERIKL